uniref:Putative transposase OCP n=1 Tax=uncultured Ralstonia sp. TaxID=114715 RepID=Q6PSS8_9RALS|nr:putative transposase OCP [uncultured Ralstonia sp.]
MENGSDEGNESALHAGVQAGSGQAGQGWPEHGGDGEDPGHCATDAAQLDPCGPRRSSGGGWKQAGEPRADGDRQAARGAGAGQDGARHPGKSDGVLREGAGVKYAWIERNRKRWPVSVACAVLGVSPSGYHDHRVRQARPRRGISNDALLVHIRAIHAETRGEYGWPRIWKELLARGIRVGKERVRKLMSLHGIRARGKRKFKATTDSNHKLPVAPNLVDRQFKPATPNAVWTSDITYVATDEGWLYLAVIIDLFSRQVVGWSMQPHMRRELVIDALHMAWFRRHPPPGLICHSDRGSQYCSADFQKALTGYGMRSSMSRKGNCWDNAPTESLWGSLKVGRLHGKRFKTRRDAMDEIVDWLTFYNHRRLHSSLGYVSPMQFERAWLAAQKRQAA